ncbi:MAG TPA: GAF domain-containing protein, partial [Aggregatilineales bacterium]|nr:GAF domain-containing protein [Aggregatilineales bacterium]
DSLEETGILYQAIRAFSNAEDTNGILQAIIDYAADPTVDKALLCLLLTDDWDSPNALMEVAVSWVRSDSVDLTGMRFTSEQFPSWEQISTSDILWVNDVMQDPTLDDTARMGYRALDIASFAVVPLGMGGKSIGAILLGSSAPRVHSDREIRIYQSLADQAAITMENIRLLDEAERRARQLATSARVSQAASSILKINELLPEMVDLIKDAFDYDHVQVFLLNTEETDAILQASTGEAGRQLLAVRHSLPVGSRSVIGTVTATGRPSIALDTADARVIHKPNPYLPNTRSEMAIPLIAKNKILGALDVQSNQPGAFTEGDVRVLSVLADQLAVAIENASLFELSQQRSEEMSFLFTVTAESTSAGELEQILRRVSDLLLEQMGADIVIPYLYDEDERLLQVGAVSARSRDIPQSVYEAVSTGSDILAIGPALSKMPVLRRTINSLNDRPVLRGMKSGVYVPLITAERVIGVLALESSRAEQFENSSLTLLQAFTGSLSAVIQNQRLLVDIRAANERLREIDKLKTNFLAAMSHELRTPLNSIIGFSRVILKGIDGPITDTQQQDLQTIHDSGKHLLGLVNDILDQAKIEAGKMQLSIEYFDLTRVIDSVMSSAEGLTKEKPIRLYTEIA